MTKKANAWFAYWHPNPQARLRLFCFPYAGGGASVFGSWSNLLPPWVEVCPIQLPGRENRVNEAPFKRLSVLLEELIEDLLPVFDLPFAFFGHSMGALISFELTHRLQQCNLSLPSQLFISGFGAPQAPDPQPPIHQLPLEEFVAAVRRYNGTPEEVWQHEELVKLLLPYLRADFEICETYIYQPDILLPMPITVYGGHQDPGIKLERLKAWREQTTKTCAVHMLPGDHFFLHSSRDQLLRTLSQELITETLIA
jgi:Predicted thioesterase involved in non-ribosomal peptide biosynthesis